MSLSESTWDSLNYLFIYSGGQSALCGLRGESCNEGRKAICGRSRLDREVEKNSSRISELWKSVYSRTC
ncbi:hypothetical protein CEXT_243201 [Caerostris extrusa]|uniref:Uncharacterized protein n=1 Tax=Caerostris extrusa TaxID=172846 RepID=A0AAV4S209_CAEEX|nr:hypothetical protein CEXT_243201 [Caerostris extrusa]